VKRREGEKDRQTKWRERERKGEKEKRREG